MTRTQIQLPKPLLERLRRIARSRDLSLAEVVRRGMEQYARTFLDPGECGTAWKLPVLRGSGGHRTDPTAVRAEALATR